MYRITCDGYSLLDTRDENLILFKPKVALTDNAAGGASFTIYKNHPYYDRLAMMRSVFEISDEYGVIFRGRMTEHSKDIKKGKAVDLEGVMTFFNDSIVRPYTFPKDWEKESHPDHSGYVAAKASGNVVKFYLGWLIEQHNAQVDEFQRFKLGNVTVSDKNNYIERWTSEYPNTFEEIKSKLFDSALGGHICIRYEADGNYIDYLAEYTEVNQQGIVYGENLRDFSEVEDGKQAYSAIIPIGEETTVKTETGENYEGMYGTIVGEESVKVRLTITSLPDGDITDDIVKRGDMLYSKRAVAAYGWRYVPSAEATWDDVTLATNLQDRGVEVLEGSLTQIPKIIECTAVDLHCTDEQIRSFRMYKKIPVYVAPHGISADLDITKLDIDLLNPQNTKITAGKTIVAMTDLQAKQKDEVKTLVTKQTVELGKVEVATAENTKNISMVVTDGKVNGSLLIDAINGESTAKISADRLELDGKTLDISVDATNITGQLTAKQIDATDLKVAATNITDKLVVGNLPDGVAMDDDIPTRDDIVTITENTITAEYIQGLKLQVGKEITMGANAKISWENNVDGKPTIPTDTIQLKNSAGYQTSNQVTEITKNTITAEYINGLNITADQADVAKKLTVGDIFSADDTTGKVTIGGWTVDDNSLHSNGTFGTDGYACICSEGSTTSANIAGSGSKSGWVFTAGSSFGVDTDGNLYANSGKIGGWTLAEGYLKHGDVTGKTPNYNYFYMGTEDDTDLWVGGSISYDDWRLIIGSSFGVREGGEMWCSSGHIGGWTIDTVSLNINSGEHTGMYGGYGISDTSLVTPNGTSYRRLYAGAPYSPSDPDADHDQKPKFYVLADGSLYASAAKIKGHIEATSGSFNGAVTAVSGNIGNWLISSGCLSTMAKMENGSYPKGAVALTVDGVEYWSPLDGKIFASWQDIAYKCRSTT